MVKGRSRPWSHKRHSLPNHDCNCGNPACSICCCFGPSGIIPNHISSTTNKERKDPVASKASTLRTKSSLQGCMAYLIGVTSVTGTWLRLHGTFTPQGIGFIASTPSVRVAHFLPLLGPENMACRIPKRNLQDLVDKHSFGCIGCCPQCMLEGLQSLH